MEDLHQNRAFESLRIIRKTRRRDALAIHPKNAQWIKAYMNAAGYATDPEGPLFRPLSDNRKMQLTRRPMHTDAIDGVLRKHAMVLRLDRGYSAHSMRATFITTAIENGCSLEDARRAAGHREPGSTKLNGRRAIIRRSRPASLRRTNPWQFVLRWNSSMPSITPYAAAAEKYSPQRTNVLFLAEAPPEDVDRYFYFEKVKRDDWLWIALMKALYPSEWGHTRSERQRKQDWLLKFQKSRFRLIDAVKMPLYGSNPKRVRLIQSAAHALIEEIKKIAPKQVVLIKATVHDALFHELRDVRLPVVNAESLPFPGSGHQTYFHEELRRLIDTGKLRT